MMRSIVRASDSRRGATRRKALEAVIVIQARLHELEGAVGRDPGDLAALAEARLIGSLLTAIACGRYPGAAIESVGRSLDQPRSAG